VIPLLSRGDKGKRWSTSSTANGKGLEKKVKKDNIKEIS